MTKVKTFKPGDSVHYSPSLGKKENGVVKSVNGTTVFVVYHCNGEWHRYKEYTAAATSIADLKPGWIN